MQDGVFKLRDCFTDLLGRVLTERIGRGVPKLTGEPYVREDLPHLIRLRAPRGWFQSRGVPGRREFPQLIHGDDRPHRMPTFLAPLSHAFFRPEEEHVASRENDVFPPPRSWHETVKDPLSLLGPVL